MDGYTAMLLSTNLNTVLDDKINDAKLINKYYEIINNRFYSKKQLNITSKDIINLTNKKELTSYYIDMVSYAIIEGKLENSKDEIINYILEKM